MSIQTISTTNSLKHNFTVISKGGKEKTVIKIRLNDECKNGHEDFSITADIYEKRRGESWQDVGGGCCHEHILSIRPDLAPFAALHLATWEGVPMHALANAFYWFCGFVPVAGEKYHGGSGSNGKPPEECQRIFAEYIRATPEQVAAIVAASPRTKEEMQCCLEDMGFPEQWEAEARAAITQLEEWTGQKFESQATRGKWEPLPAEARQVILERRESGYYSPEQVAARDAERREALRAKKVAGVRADFAASREKLDRQESVAVYLADNFPDGLNVIYYDHTNRLAVNWSNCDKLLSRAEFDALSAGLDYSKLPAGLTLEWQERPKY